jgi:hypothetical protein
MANMTLKVPAHQMFDLGRTTFLKCRLNSDSNITPDLRPTSNVLSLKSNVLSLTYNVLSLTSSFMAAPPAFRSSPFTSFGSYLLQSGPLRISNKPRCKCKNNMNLA